MSEDFKDLNFKIKKEIIADTRLTSPAFRLYCIIQGFEQNNIEAKVDFEYMKKILGWTKKKFDDALSNLVEFGYID